MGQHSSLLRTFVNRGRETFCKIDPRHCIIKLFTTVLYRNFCNKLECLSLARVSSLGYYLKVRQELCESLTDNRVDWTGLPGIPTA
jgi:hypothetical protein